MEAWCCRTGKNLDTRVFNRDRGVCAACGFDCEQMRRQWWPFRPRLWSRTGDFIALHQLDIIVFLTSRGFTAKDARRRRFWDIDHIVPVVEGGGSCGMSNLRTLCIPCHRKATAELAAKRAAARRKL